MNSLVASEAMRRATATVVDDEPSVAAISTVELPAAKLASVRTCGGRLRANANTETNEKECKELQEKLAHEEQAPKMITFEQA